MTKIEKILTIVIAVSLLLKSFAMPFAGVVLVISLCTLAAYYFIFARCIFSGVSLKQRFQPGAFDDQSKSVAIISALSGYAIAVLCYAALFRLQHWAFWPTLFLIEGVSCFALLVAVTLAQLKQEDVVYKSMSWRLTAFLVFGLAAWVGI